MRLPLIDSNQAELEANYFAMHLLMPKVLLDKAIGNEPLTDSLIERIAREFKVQECWVTIRLQEYFAKRV